MFRFEPGHPRHCMLTDRDGFVSDAEACAKVAIEIITRRRPKIWRDVFKSADEEADYVRWVATWAFHWAAKVKTGS